MKRSNGHSLPKARKNDLVTRQVPGELLIYDLKRHKAFCLNDTAASVWTSCNGKRTVKDLALELEKDQHTRVDDKVIWLALDQLEKSNLLQSSVVRPLGFAPISRRSLLRAGIITAVTLPVVTMIISPTAVQAASPITSNTCQGRHDNDIPGGGGCLGTPCSDAPGNCSPQGNSCHCA